MDRQMNEAGEGDLGNNRSDVMVRAVYYAVIVGLGLMLAMVVYLAR
jgi:hypothetical protein